MELNRSKDNAVRVINEKKSVFTSLLVGTIMTTCISCSLIDEEIKVKPINNNVNFCEVNNISVSDKSVYLNKGKGPNVKILHTEKNEVELLLEKNNSTKIINAQINSKFRINDTPVQICSINNSKNEISIASSKEITLVPYKENINELYTNGIFALIIISMAFGCSKGLKNSENNNGE